MRFVGERLHRRLLLSWRRRGTPAVRPKKLPEALTPLINLCSRLHRWLPPYRRTSLRKPRTRHSSGPFGTLMLPQDAARNAPPSHVRSSLIGRLGSSAFRPSTTAVSMSLAGSCFSSESAPRPFHHGIRRRGGTISGAALPLS